METPAATGTIRTVHPLFRWGVVVAALLLGATFVLPLWRIEIWAPQYPEGLFMQIWTGKLTGDLRNINLLNHYIGMHSIHEEDFKEMRLFPVAFGALMALGVLAGLVGKKMVLYLWSLLLLVFCTGAFIDFYLWESHFGSELNPDAAIKMEGMTYSPPLLGKKELLNIEAWSLPGGAGIAIFAAVAVVFVGCILQWQLSKKSRKV